MTARDVSTILLVDDYPEQLNNLKSELLSSATGLACFVEHPQDVTRELVRDADVVLVDWRLDRWEERLRIGDVPSLQPQDGLALAAVLRSHVPLHSRPKAFALHSAQLENLSGAVPTEIREHALARIHNLEWVFPKRDASDHLARQIAVLADGIRQLPDDWPADDASRTRETVMRLFGLDPNGAWTGEAWRGVEACHPPIYELSRASDGIAFLRWLLHRVLPYPCFLLNRDYLRARLRVTEVGLSSIESEPSSKLWQELEAVRYSGVLGQFLGGHWWKAGVDALLWNLTGGRSLSVDALQQGIQGASESSVEFITEFPEAVVCLGADYRVLPRLYSPNDAVRIQPDDWPPYADDAWSPVDLVLSSPHLNAIVIDSDRVYLSDRTP